MYIILYIKAIKRAGLTASNIIGEHKRNGSISQIVTVSYKVNFL